MFDIISDSQFMHEAERMRDYGHTWGPGIDDVTEADREESDRVWQQHLEYKKKVDELDIKPSEDIQKFVADNEHLFNLDGLKPYEIYKICADREIAVANFLSDKYGASASFNNTVKSPGTFFLNLKVDENGYGIIKEYAIGPVDNIKDFLQIHADLNYAKCFPDSIDYYDSFRDNHYLSNYISSGSLQVKMVKDWNIEPWGDSEFLKENAINIVIEEDEYNTADNVKSRASDIIKATSMDDVINVTFIDDKSQESTFSAQRLGKDLWQCKLNDSIFNCCQEELSYRIGTLNYNSEDSDTHFKSCFENFAKYRPKQMYEAAMQNYWKIRNRAEKSTDIPEPCLSDFKYEPYPPMDYSHKRITSFEWIKNPYSRVIYSREKNTDINISKCVKQTKSIHKEQTKRADRKMNKER